MALLTNKPLEQSVRILERSGSRIFSVGGWRRRTVAAEACARRHEVSHDAKLGAAPTIRCSSATRRSICKRRATPACASVSRATDSASRNFRRRFARRRGARRYARRDSRSAAWTSIAPGGRARARSRRSSWTAFARSRRCRPQDRRRAGDAFGGRLQLHRERDFRDVRDEERYEPFKSLGHLPGKRRVRRKR